MNLYIHVGKIGAFLTQYTLYWVSSFETNLNGFRSVSKYIEIYATKAIRNTKAEKEN